MFSVIVAFSIICFSPLAHKQVIFENNEEGKWISYAQSIAIMMIDQSLILFYSEIVKEDRLL